MKIHLTAIIALSLATPLTGFGAKLLSDNQSKTGVASYPGTTSQVQSDGSIHTGATYEFLVDASAGKGIGNTDPDIVKLGVGKLFDGYNERVGRTAVYGAWQASEGATVLIDLQQAYAIEAVSASMRTSGRRGADTIIVQVSTDGSTFTPFGTWEGEATVLDNSESDAGRNSEAIIVSDTPVPARYVKVFLTHWNKDQSKRMLSQLVIGEIAVWGDAVAQ